MPARALGGRLRSGVYMAANEKQGQPRSANRSVHAFRGTAFSGMRVQAAAQRWAETLSYSR